MIPKIFIKHKLKTIIFLIVLVAYYFCLPTPLFNKPYSTVLDSSDKQLLGAVLAKDGQWRFPVSDSIPYKFKMAITHFEDEYFFHHWGINPVSTAKAFFANFKAKATVRGGSTLTQQTIRLARGSKKRSYKEKIIEAILATRLEFSYSKEEILSLYSAHAPFGGNIVGLEVAAWRYFGLKPHQLSWAETATLAVLPNAPSLIYPGKNQEILHQKRDSLLVKLHTKGLIDKETLALALLEPILQKPKDLPQITPHLLQLANKTNTGQKIHSTINYDLQQLSNSIVENYYKQYSQSEIYNIGALIIDIESREVLTYIGNSPTTIEHQKDVDMMQAARSTGSILKPLLSMAALDDGIILPKTLLYDIPTVISGYKPKNYSETYEGAVHADEALFRSLNIPFVLLLQNYGVHKFYDKLQHLSFKNIKKHPNHYGLSLILGGAESSLWEIAQAYTSLASTLNHYNKSKNYRKKEVNNLLWNKAISIDFGESTTEPHLFGAGSIYSTFKALTQVNRPEGEEAWQYYDSASKIAWKTGTSFGGRDAWAIGVDKKYAVAVWVGNATGEGRPTISGVRQAGPILFDLFKLLPNSDWFNTPYDDLEEVETCETSGYLATELCPKNTEKIPFRATRTSTCPYHQLLHVDTTESYQVNSSCQNISSIKSIPFFILPPTVSYYYKRYHQDYLLPPPLREDCYSTTGFGNINFIYPKHNDEITLTLDFNSQKQPFIAKAATNSREDIIYWYLDKVYLGKTELVHEMSIKSTVGSHLLTIVDAKGNERTITIKILSK